MKRYSKSIVILVALTALISAFAQDKTDPAVFQGQAPAREVDTTTKPIEVQKRQIFAFEEDGVFFSNNFDGARLNSISRDSSDSYTIKITPENRPINMSPWYAFKIRSSKKKRIKVRLAYPEFAKHRYSPRISRDGKKWRVLSDKYITEEEKGTGTVGAGSRPQRIVMDLKVSKKPIWIAAQELQTSKHVFSWMTKLARKRNLEISEFGKSTQGRPLKVIRIGKPGAKRMMIVISRQHPPEVTGYLAMQAFVSKIADNSRLSRKFRDEWRIYVVPLMNPDGVDNGHWRHSAGGVDLNRDWTKFNQPEGRQLSEFLKEREQETGGKFYFGIDFHSTWDDVYYPMGKDQQESHMPGLVYEWIGKIKKAIPGYEPNVRPNTRPKPAIISRNYFYFSHGMEAIVFEIGDNTSRKFIRKKGETGAKELMKLLLERQNEKTNPENAK